MHDHVKLFNHRYRIVMKETTLQRDQFGLQKSIAAGEATKNAIEISVSIKEGSDPQQKQNKNGKK